MNGDTIMGPLRAIAPVIVGWLVAKGIDSVTAGFITAAITAVMAAVWSYFTNRLISLAAKVAATPGVQVVVGPSAPVDMKELALNPAIPNVVTAK